MSLRADKTAPKQPCWKIDYVDENGKRHRKRFYGTKSHARQQYALILKRVETIKNDPSIKDRQMPVIDLVQRYIHSSQIDGKNPYTIKRIKNATDAFISIIGGNTHIGDINAQLIEQYKAMRLQEKTPRKNKLSKGGLNTELRHLRAMFNWAVKTDILQTSPMKATTLIKTNPKPVRFLLPEEIKKLFRVINENNDEVALQLIEMYIRTGARRSELLPPKLTWKSFDFETETIVLIGKRNKRRTNPINSEIIKLITDRKNHGYEHPFPYSPDQAYRIVTKYFRLAGIENASTHTLRKTCGALLIQDGVDIYRVSKYLGHSSVSVTERHYVDLLPSEYSDLLCKIDSQLKKYSILENEVPYYCHFLDQTRPKRRLEYV